MSGGGGGAPVVLNAFTVLLTNTTVHYFTKPVYALIVVFIDEFTSVSGYPFPYISCISISVNNTYMNLPKRLLNNPGLCI